MQLGWNKLLASLLFNRLLRKVHYGFLHIMVNAQLCFNSFV